MLTFQYIVRLTDPLRKLNAKLVKIVKFKTGYTTRGTGYAACQSYSTHHYDQHGRKIPNADRNRYVTVVEFVDKKLHCNVSCSCPDFMYRHEVALNRRGAADIEYSNGEMPTTTNPELRVATCKHLIALYLRIRAKLGK